MSIHSPTSPTLGGHLQPVPAAGSFPSEPDANPADTSVTVTVSQVLQTLLQGEMTEQGLLPYSSNYNFLVTVTDGDLQVPAVYKPRRGETPLWDFPPGTLHLREIAAYLVSATLGWHMVPPTVLRNGTWGTGSVQLFIDADPDEHYFTMREDARFARIFRQIALFDFVINNADRKSGHCLLGSDHNIWAIDHGICFHSEYKLRTVIWEFSGQPIEPDLLADLRALQQRLSDPLDPVTRQLDRFLNRSERRTLYSRIGRLLMTGVYPSPPPHRRNYPWPPI